MADFEHNLVSKILFSGEIKDVLDRRIDDRMFVDDRNRKVFIFILSYYKNYGELPTIETVELEFPDYKISHVKEPANYYIDKILETYVRNKGSEILLSNTKLLVSDPLKGLEELQSKFSKLTLEANPTEDVNFLESTAVRKQKYLDLKNMKGIDGHPTPWQVLDKATMGLHPEEFAVIVSRPGIGKSFMLIMFAEFAWAKGLNVLFITQEMAVQQIERRFDAVHFKLPYKELRAGLLADGHERRYFEGLDALKESGRPPMWTIGDASGVASISAKIDEYKPDMVLVDGMYLLQDDRRGSNKWERTSNISWDLKQLTKKKKLPIVATTQFNRMADEAKVGMDQVNLAMLGFSDSIGQDADIVIGLFRNKDMMLNREMYVRMLKLREGEPVDFTLQWDLHSMMFDVLRVTDDSQVIEDDEIDEEDINY